jgi:hypothetical protein
MGRSEHSTVIITGASCQYAGKAIDLGSQPEANNEARASRLWDLGERMVGLG